MVSALDSGSRGPGSSPGRVIELCSWAKRFTLTKDVSFCITGRSQQTSFNPLAILLQKKEQGDSVSPKPLPFMHHYHHHYNC